MRLANREVGMPDCGWGHRERIRELQAEVERLKADRDLLQQDRDLFSENFGLIEARLAKVQEAARTLADAVVAQDGRTWWLSDAADRARMRYIENGPDRKLAAMMVAVDSIRTFAATEPEEPKAEGKRKGKR